jgi:hypothetical protein
MTSDQPSARDYAELAAKTAAKLKPGSYDSVQALALLSIAHSLVTLTENNDAAK